MLAFQRTPPSVLPAILGPRSQPYLDLMPDVPAVTRDPHPLEPDEYDEDADLEHDSGLRSRLAGYTYGAAGGHDETAAASSTRR